MRDLLERVAEEAQFEGVNILDGSVGSIPLHVEIEGAKSIEVKLPDTTPRGLGLEAVDFSSPESAEAAVDELGSAMSIVAESRAQLSSVDGQLSSILRSVDAGKESAQPSESRINNMDGAVEMAKNARDKIVSDGGESVKAQANISNARAQQLLAT